ncbi:hypothetical protein R3P38DRAFT_3277083, partial [Favolaschia claudopus]
MSSTRHDRLELIRHTFGLWIPQDFFFPTHHTLNFLTGSAVAVPTPLQLRLGTHLEEFIPFSGALMGCLRVHPVAPRPGVQPARFPGVFSSPTPNYGCLSINKPSVNEATVTRVSSRRFRTRLADTRSMVLNRLLRRHLSTQRKSAHLLPSLHAAAAVLLRVGGGKEEQRRRRRTDRGQFGCRSIQRQTLSESRPPDSLDVDKRKHLNSAPTLPEDSFARIPLDTSPPAVSVLLALSITFFVAHSGSSSSATEVYSPGRAWDGRPCARRNQGGKTAVFVLATLQQLEPVNGEVSVLVLCHTRELAFHIKNEYTTFREGQIYGLPRLFTTAHPRLFSSHPKHIADPWLSNATCPAHAHSLPPLFSATAVSSETAAFSTQLHSFQERNPTPTTLTMFLAVSSHCRPAANADVCRHPQQTNLHDLLFASSSLSKPCVSWQLTFVLTPQTHHRSVASNVTRPSPVRWFPALSASTQADTPRSKTV